MYIGKFDSNRLSNISSTSHNHDLLYEPIDAAIVKSDEAETITTTWTFENASENVILKGAGSGTANQTWMSIRDSINALQARLGFLSNTTNHLYFRNETSGNIYIGTDASNDLTIVTGGAATFVSTVTATNFIKASDRRKKQNIKGFSSRKFSDVNFVEYELKAKPGIKQYGVIADEIREVYPEVVYKGEDGMLGVDYESLSIIGLQKVQELERLLNTSIWRLILAKIKKWFND